MFIAHLPAAYLALKAAPRTAAPLGAAFLIGSVLPDLDMAYFYTIGARQTHHHDYITHRPALWAGLFLLGLGLQQRWLWSLGAGALLYLLLDSPLGQIAWGWPLTDAAQPLVTVPARYEFWVWSFVLHWTFLIEIALVLAACLVFLKQRKTRFLS